MVNKKSELIEIKTLDYLINRRDVLVVEYNNILKYIQEESDSGSINDYAGSLMYIHGQISEIDKSIRHIQYETKAMDKLKEYLEGECKHG